jgi:hypothetical protein
MLNRLALEAVAVLVVLQVKKTQILLVGVLHLAVLVAVAGDT